MQTVLAINGLTKKYGNLTAVNNLSLEVEKGSVFGILGPNGSGKTTTLGIILGVTNKNAGSYSWFGEEPSHNSLKRIGAILETPNFYPYMSAYQNLKVVADIKGVSYDKIEAKLKLVNLAHRQHHKFSTYSLGMKQRLAIASALLNDPEILVLDEPTNGLDPQGIAEVRRIINEIAATGTTIVIASHLLDEVEKVCTHVAVIKNGKTLFNGRVEELSSTGVIEAKANDMEKLEATLKQYTGVTSANVDGNLLIGSYDGEINGAELNKYLMDNGVLVSHLVVKRSSLEQQFLQLTNKK